MTNAERIRMMEAGELFSLLKGFRDRSVDYAKYFCDMCVEESVRRGETTDCDECLRWWLNDIDCAEHEQGIDYGKKGERFVLTKDTTVGEILKVCSGVSCRGVLCPLYGKLKCRVGGSDENCLLPYQWKVYGKRHD